MNGPRRSCCLNGQRWDQTPERDDLAERRQHPADQKTLPAVGVPALVLVD